MFKNFANKPGVLPWLWYEGLLGPFSAFFITLLFPLHLRKLVGDGPQTDYYWGLINSISLAVVAVSTLFWGPWMDRRGTRLGFLRATGALVIAGAVLALLPSAPLAALIAYGVALLNFQWTNVAYNAYLNDLAEPVDRSQLSGVGWATGYLFNMVLLLAALPILLKHGERGPWLALWMVPVAGLLCYLPAALRLPPVAPKVASGPPIWGLLKIRPLLLFLFASALYMDGITTVIEFAGRFATETFGFTAVGLLGIFAILQVCGAAGAFAIGAISRRTGEKPALLVTLILWCVALLGLHRAQGQGQFLALAAVAGAGMGAAGAGSRSLLSRLLPAGREAEGYGLFAITTRFGAIFGPALFGIVSKAHGQRTAVLTLIPFFVAGGVLLTLVAAPRHDDAQPSAA